MKLRSRVGSSEQASVQGARPCRAVPRTTRRASFLRPTENRPISGFFMEESFPISGLPMREKELRDDGWTTLLGWGRCGRKRKKKEGSLFVPL